MEIKTRNNKVLDMKGKTISTNASIEIQKPRDPDSKKPDAVGIALLQARSLFNSLDDITDEVHKLGVDTGDSALQDHKYRVLKAHYYSFGLFWVTLLKALKNRDDLKAWSPELFEHDVECPNCEGEGKIPYKVGSPEYDEAFNAITDFGDSHEYGSPIFKHCSPCQGVGYVYLNPRNKK